MLQGILKTAIKTKLNSAVSRIGIVAIMVDFKLLNIENRSKNDKAQMRQ